VRVRSTLGQIIERAHHRWKLVVFVGRDDNGKRRFCIKTVTANKKAAQEFLRKRLREKDLG